MFVWELHSSNSLTAEIESIQNSITLDDFTVDSIPNGLTVSYTQINQRGVDIFLQGTPLVAGTYNYGITLNSDCSTTNGTIMWTIPLKFREFLKNPPKIK